MINPNQPPILAEKNHFINSSIQKTDHDWKSKVYIFCYLRVTIFHERNTSN